MARAITTEELALLRTEGQWSELFMAIHKPAVVYSARINQVFTTWDGVAELTYDGGSGTLANVLPGMTVYVGSNAGAYDKGMIRVRKAPTATVLYIGETSDIAYQDNDYLTVVDEFGLWAKHPTLDDDGVVYMDYDVAYTDQHKSPDPVPVLGPSAAVLWLTGANVVFYPDASASWVLGGSISAYAWSAPGASATAGMSTATPTITYNAAGQYRVSCTVTASNGKTTTGYRWAFVFDAAHPPVNAFQLKSCSGYADDGGWKFTVEMYDQAALADVRDRALVVLFARDHFGADTQSLGPVSGYENLIATGWIDGENITDDPDQSTVEFTVQGPHNWLGKLPNFAIGLTNSSVDPTTWGQIKNLSVDKALWHALHWHSTATTMLDIALSGDLRLAPSTESTAGVMWDQLKSVAGMILAAPICDRFGRLGIEIDGQYLATGDRSSIPVVMSPNKSDWHDQITIERRTTCETSMVDISGVSYNGTTTTQILSRAAGKIYKACGHNKTVDKLLFSDQAEANLMAGAIHSRSNCVYPMITIPLAANNRMLDICPRQFIDFTLDPADTPRGVTLTGVHLIPRTVSYSQDVKTGALTAEIDFELETFPGLAIAVDIPQTPEPNIPDQPIYPPYFPIIPGPFGPVPPVIPVPPDVGPCSEGPANGPFKMWVEGEIDSTDDYPLHTGWISGGLQGGSNPTTVTIDGCAQSSDDGGVTWQDASSADMGLQLKAVGPGEGFIAYGSGGGGSGCGQYTFTFSGSGQLGGFQATINSTPQCRTQDGYSRVDADFNASGGAGHWTYAPLTFPAISVAGKLIWKAVAFQGYGGGPEHKFDYMDASNAGLSPTIFYDSSDFTVTEGQWNISGSDGSNPNWNADMDALFGAGWTTKGWPGHNGTYDGSYAGFGSIKIHEPDIPVHGEGIVALVFKGLPRIYRFIINEMYASNLCQEGA
jgi:hypothetical protein